MEAVGGAHIIITLDTKEPIEIGDFVSVFTSVSNQYVKFISANYPELTPDAKLFVREIKEGSIIADLIPFAPLFGAAAIVPILTQMDAIIEFVQKYGGKIKKYINKKDENSASPSDLKDFLGTVKAIANDPNGKAALEAAHFADDKREIRASLVFSTPDARAALEAIEEHQRRLETRDHETQTRVLMAFTQSNIKNSPVEKRTGERVVIEDISPSDLPLVYASDLAERKIKHEIREADENVFKKGFIVDVSVLRKNDKPAAYRVTNLHQVIDLPGD